MPKSAERKREGTIVALLPLTTTVVFPTRVATVQVNVDENLALLKDHPGADELVALGFCEPGTRDDIRAAVISRVAVLARIIDRIKLPGEGFRITLQGLQRVEIDEIVEEKPYFKARTFEIEERTRDPFRVKLYVQKAINFYERLASVNGQYPKDLTHLLKVNVDNPARFADLLSASVDFDYAERHRIIQAVAVDQRLQRVLELLRGALDRVKVAQEVEKRAKGDIEESRREYYLRQQLKTIQKELGDEDLSRRDADDYEDKIGTLGLPDDVTREAMREIERLRHIQPSSSEYQVIKTYLDRFFALPWGVHSDEHIELKKVKTSLDEGHFGLVKVKERILEFLAVRKLNPGHKGPILCFVGPPGVGKTSLGKSIAEAIGRKFFRISVGGVRDEAEIRGHRRTYVGALPGKILNGLTRAGCMNPLLMLDEIDKIGSDHRGDPASALLEVLDPEQNSTFTDHYFNVPFDLSKVLFVVTANYLHDIPKPLLDRLEVISIEGYTETEKLEIKSSIYCRVSSTNMVSPIIHRCLKMMLCAMSFNTGLVKQVSGSESKPEKICRKLAQSRLRPSSEIDYASPELSPPRLNDYLGPRRFLMMVVLSGTRWV